MTSRTASGKAVTTIAKPKTPWWKWLFFTFPDKSKAFREGFKGGIANPYPKGTQEFSDFEEGNENAYEMQCW